GASAAPWQVSASRNGAPARAGIANDQGDRLAVFADRAGAVTLEFAPAAPSPLRTGSCPTFQIDARPLLHHGRAGETCTVDDHQARYSLGRADNRRLESPPLYQLMNGSSVAFRFATRDGAYHEAKFPLTRSKNAILRVLGRDLDVQPGAAVEPP
ncbi:MAG: hypothetical protein RLW42_03980, partial [Gammaproteobacteria bacterium]